MNVAAALTLATDLQRLVPDTCDERCEHAIFNNGWTAAVLGSAPRANVIEKWVRALAKDAGASVDWHYAGGRARILALPDSPDTRARVRSSLEKFLPVLAWVYYLEQLDDGSPAGICPLGYSVSS